MSINLSTNMLDLAIEHEYQKIFHLPDEKVFGYEALLRFSGGFSGGNIEDAFELARENGYLYELDTKSIANAVGSFPVEYLGEELLFINIYPSTLLHDQFESFIIKLLKLYPQLRGKVVFELNEAQTESDYWNVPSFKNKINFLKMQGFNIALDDVGKGAATIPKIIEFSPDYVKLDRYFAKDLHVSEEKQKFISLFIELLNPKIGLVLEGIEEKADLEQAKKLNVPVIQGYLLGRPQKVSALDFDMPSGFSYNEHLYVNHIERF